MAAAHGLLEHARSVLPCGPDVRRGARGEGGERRWKTEGWAQMPCSPITVHRKATCLLGCDWSTPEAKNITHHGFLLALCCFSLWPTQCAEQRVDFSFHFYSEISHNFYFSQQHHLPPAALNTSTDDHFLLWDCWSFSHDFPSSTAVFIALVCCSAL